MGGPERIETCESGRKENSGRTNGKRGKRPSSFVGGRSSVHVCLDACADASVYACAVGKREGVCSLGDSKDGLLGNHPS